MPARSRARPVLDPRCAKTTLATWTATLGPVRCGLAIAISVRMSATQRSFLLHALVRVGCVRPQLAGQSHAATIACLLTSRGIRAATGLTTTLSVKMLHQRTRTQRKPRLRSSPHARCRVDFAAPFSSVWTDPASSTKASSRAASGKTLIATAWTHDRQTAPAIPSLAKLRSEMPAPSLAACASLSLQQQRHVLTTPSFVMSTDTRAAIGLPSRWSVRMPQRCTRTPRMPRQRCLLFVHWRAARAQVHAPMRIVRPQSRCAVPAPPLPCHCEAS